MPLHPSTAPLFLDHVISSTAFSKKRTRPTSAPHKRKDKSEDPSGGTESSSGIPKVPSDSEANDFIRNRLRKLKLKLIGELQLVNEAVSVAGTNMRREEYRKHVFETADYIMKEFISITAIDKTDMSAFIHNLWALVVSLQPHDLLEEAGKEEEDGAIGDARGKERSRAASNKASQVYYQPRDSFHRLKVPFYPAECQTDPAITGCTGGNQRPSNSSKDSLSVLEQNLQLMEQTLECQTKSIALLVDSQRKVASLSNSQTSGKRGILPDVCKLEATRATSASHGTSNTVARIMDDSSDDEGDALLSPSWGGEGGRVGGKDRDRGKEDAYVASGYKVYTNAANLSSHIKHTVGNLENYIQVLEQESAESKAKCERLETQLHFYRKQLELTSSDIYSLRVEMASETSRRVKAETELSSLAVVSEMKIIPKSSVDTQTDDDMLQPTSSPSFASMAVGNHVTSKFVPTEPPSRLPLNQVGHDINNKGTSNISIIASNGKKPVTKHTAKAPTALSLRKALTLPAPIAVKTPRDPSPALTLPNPNPDLSPALTLQPDETNYVNANTASGVSARNTPRGVASMENSVASISSKQGKRFTQPTKRGKGKCLVRTCDAAVQVEFDNDFVRTRNNQSIEHFFLKAAKTNRFNFMDSGDIERSFFSERGKIVGRQEFHEVDDGAVSETESDRIASLIWKRR